MADDIDWKLDRFLSRPEVLSITDLSGTTLAREVRAGRFPCPFRLTRGRRVGWKESDVRAWLHSRERTRSMGDR